MELHDRFITAAAGAALGVLGTLVGLYVAAAWLEARRVGPKPPATDDGRGIYITTSGTQWIDAGKVEYSPPYDFDVPQGNARSYEAPPRKNVPEDLTGIPQAFVDWGRE